MNNPGFYTNQKGDGLHLPFDLLLLLDFFRKNFDSFIQLCIIR